MSPLEQGCPKLLHGEPYYILSLYHMEDNKPVVTALKDEPRWI